MAQQGLPRRVKTLAKVALCKVNQYLHRFDDRLFILGEGRSGTTWLMNILNFDDRYRVLFEPFLTENFKNPVTYASEYPFPDAPGRADVSEHVRRVLRGDYISHHATLRFPRALFQGLLIKDVSAHLILDEICSFVPDIKCVLILRHPFAVASSKARAYSWPTSPLSFVSGYNPSAGLYVPHQELIETIVRDNDPLLIQILLWCMAFKAAFAANSIDSFVIVFYEDLVTEPAREVRRLFGELGWAQRYEAHRAQIETTWNAPSHVTLRQNAIEQSKVGRAQWKAEWSGQTIERGLEIISSLGMDFLYGDDYQPRVTAAELQNRLAQGDLKVWPPPAPTPTSL